MFRESTHISGHESAGVSSEGVTLEIRDLTVILGATKILDAISFRAEPGQLTGIIGPNGAGKTTLLRALAGKRPYSGRILMNGSDLYDAPEYWLHRIGYVPVDNVLHEWLRVHEALMFAGRLRLPGLLDDEIRTRVDGLLDDFRCSDTRNKLIKDLSSGERKRVNICAELLVDPQVILMDESTSNLDPNAELELMQKLRKKAHEENKTILIVTHTLNSIDECDSVIFVENSKIRAAAPPQDLLPLLESEFASVDHDAPRFYRWAAMFERFDTKERSTVQLPRTFKRILFGISSELDSEDSSRNRHSEDVRNWVAGPEISSARQFSLLLRRYGRIRLNDRRTFVITLLLGVVAGGLFWLGLPEKAFAQPQEASDIPTQIVAARQSGFLLAIVIVLLGLIFAFREITQEMRIYLHERLKGLSPSVYLLARLTWLMVFIGLLVPIMTLAILWPQQHDSITQTNTSWLLALVTLIFACVAALTLALVVSATTDKETKVTIYVAIAAVVQIVFSGLLTNQRLDTLIDTLSVSAVSRWAFEGLSSSWGFYCWAGLREFKEFDSFAHIGYVWLILSTYIVVSMLIAILLLRARDPWKKADLSRLGPIKKSTGFVLVALVAVLLSWAFSLRGTSQAYHELTYFDRDYSGTRFARVEDIEHSQIQGVVGVLSQSQCGVR